MYLSEIRIKVIPFLEKNVSINTYFKSGEHV